MGIIDYAIFILVIWLIFEIVKDVFVKNLSPELKKAKEKIKETLKTVNTGEINKEETAKKDENGDYIVDFDKINEKPQGLKVNKEILIPVLVFLGIIFLPFLLQFAGLIFPLIVIGFIFREPLKKLFDDFINKN
ncbi:MAG: hypothetical protein M0R46_08535 [Candidatus Muirbacterium halophilum]|nr:hypothetical protein [Candidatus Muirbacterium halophilum]MCK9475951.1 hypothetical protein [Candidatus Muirbacterium halophilum]